AGLQARRTKMFPMQFAIAERAKETTARFTGQSCFLLRVIKAARLTFSDERLAIAPVRDRLEERGEHLDLQKPPALRAGLWLREIEGCFRQGRIARETMQSRIHSWWLFKALRGQKALKRADCP